ncbi:hypothetical protein N0V90_005255 [Kalmusia sp. IMI 367209]|nr:hypothetical protein N0V90_005255 [Kalmusia sp. IMI 367209]
MYRNFAKVSYIHSILVMVGISCVKISIAFSLLRLTATKSQAHFLWGAVVFIVAITIASAGTLIFQCVPVEAAWDSSLRPAPVGTGDAHCFSNTTFRDLGLVNSIFKIVTDILFATLPIPLVWKLQINIRTKISLIVVLSLGWFACAAAIVKAAQQWTVLEDPEWTIHDSFNVWNYIELTIGIVAASLPALKPLFNWALNTARAISSGGRTKATGRPSACNGANALGYHNMDSQFSNSIPMHSLVGKGNTAGDERNPYSVQLTTQHSGKVDIDTWGLVNAKGSGESIRPLEPGPKEIMITKEVCIS